MSKSEILLKKLTNLLAQGLISYKDLSNEIIRESKSEKSCNNYFIHGFYFISFSTKTFGLVIIVFS